jgi:hypothetical protein
MMPSGIKERRALITSVSVSGFLLRAPTPRASDHKGAAKPSETTKDRVASGQANLAEWIQEHPMRVPSPKASDAGPDFAAMERGKSLSLQTVVAMLPLRVPTPTAQDANNNGGPAQMERNALPLNAVAGGALNPTWVEWLMGWPLGWTDCGASGTDRFRQWCGSHGRRLADCGELTSVTGVKVTVEEEGTQNE